VIINILSTILNEVKELDAGKQIYDCLKETFSAEVLNQICDRVENLSQGSFNAEGLHKAIEFLKWI